MNERKFDHSQTIPFRACGVGRMNEGFHKFMLRNADLITKFDAIVRGAIDSIPLFRTATCLRFPEP
jgi:hypothetical protein